MSVFSTVYFCDFIEHCLRFFSRAVDKAIIDSLMHKESEKKKNDEIRDDVHEDEKHFP